MSDIQFRIIIIIIITVLTSVCPRLHGLDGSPTCHLSTQHYFAHLPASASTYSCHLPHTPSKSFYLCLYLLSLPPPYFCMLIPSHPYPYAPRVQTTLVSPGALCQTHSLSLALIFYAF